MAASSTSTDGTATPRPVQRIAENTDSTQTILNSLTNTLSKLSTDFNALNGQPPEPNDLRQMEATMNGKARQLHDEVLGYKKIHEDMIETIKSRIRVEYPNEVAKQLSPEIRSCVQAEVQARAKDELGIQFLKLMPISLRQQLAETNEQLTAAKNAVTNSEARSYNSAIDIVDSVTRNDELKLVLKPDGERSSLWPADLNSLFAYDSESVKKLLNDFELPVGKAHHDNINCFLGHIGVKQQLL